MSAYEVYIYTGDTSTFVVSGGCYHATFKELLKHSTGSKEKC